MGKFKVMGITITSFALGGFLGQLLPTPDDIVHFYFVLPWLQKNIQNPAMRPQVAVISAIDWYLLPTSFYLLLLAIALAPHVKVSDKLKAVILIFIGGIVLTSLWSFAMFGSFVPVAV